MPHGKNYRRRRYIKNHWGEFACGWGAAFINISITYPLNKLIFRQMLHGVEAYHALLQLHKEGIYYLYRGLLPPLCQKTLSLSIMFGMYEEVRKPLKAMGVNPYLAKATGALVAGSLEAIFMPFERVQTLLADSAYHNRFRNTFDAFRSIRANYGFGEYYRGLVPILLRNGPSNVCFFIIRDEIHKLMGPPSQTSVKRTAAEFICGAFIGVFLSSIFYPLNVIKISMQSRLGGEHQNIVKVFLRIYEQRGRKLRNIYYGIPANITRAFFSWGVMNAAYGNLKNVLMTETE